jgi:hypothetical protein
MIVEINYTALHWDNHKGCSGLPIRGRLLREFRDEITLSELKKFAQDEIDSEEKRTKGRLGDYILTEVVIDA